MIAQSAQGAESSPADATWRERKRCATRRALHRAALEIILEQGLEAATVHEIAQRAGVARRTFFNHFASRDEVLASPTPDMCERIVTALDARPADEPPGRALWQVARAWLLEQEADVDLRSLRKQVSLAHPEYAAMLGSGNHDLVSAVVDHVAATRPDADRMELAIVVGAVVSVVRACLAQMARGGYVDDMGVLLDRGYEALMRLPERF